MSDLFDPHTQAGQTAWGQLIHDERERARERERQNREIAERIERMNRSERQAAPVRTRPRKLTPEEKAELARREANRKLIKKGAPFLKALSGHVVSYLDAQGELIVNTANDLAPGEVVPHKVHLARLQHAHDQLWQRILSNHEGTASTDADSALWCEDARERLELSKRGRFLCPLNRNGDRLMTALIETKKGFFGSKQVKKRPWQVNAREYDRRFRLFVDLIYKPDSKLQDCTSADGTLLAAAPAASCLEFYLLLPSRRG